MEIKRKHIKCILMLIIILFILCLGKSVRAEFADLTINHKPGQDPIDCIEDQGKNGVYFFCRNEWKPWNWRGWNDVVSVYASLFAYKEDAQVTVEPTISFGIHTAKSIGQLNLVNMQNLVWGSSKYSYMNCETNGGSPQLYTNATSTVLKRADQFGMFYYGVINGGKSNLDCTITGGDTAKVFISQKDRNIILGPYQIQLKCHTATTNTNLSENVITTNLWNELAGFNTKGTNAPKFAECNITVDGASEIRFLDKDGSALNSDGSLIRFPNFNEDFYIQCKVGSNSNTLNPKININYIKNATAAAFEYSSLETITSVPGYAVLDKWYTSQGISKAQEGGNDAHNYALNVIKENVTVRRYRLCKRSRRVV